MPPTRDLDASSARVTRAGAAISRSLRQSHDTAISNVVATQIDLDSAKGLLEERTKAVSHASTVVFPEASSVIASTRGIAIPAATLAKWVARKVDAAGKPLETDDQFKTRVEGLAAQAATWLELKSTTALVDPAKARAVAASGKPGDTGLKDASDPGPEAGVRYRVGVPAVLRACKGGPCTKVGVEEGELFKTLPVTLLNRDTTFFLPFHSKAFTNGALSATFAESGVLTSAGYEQKKAAGEAVVGVLDALAAEVSTVVEADRANSKSKLEKLEEEIKLAKAEKDLADAKAALDESGNDANEDAIAALAADTALKQAQVANTIARHAPVVVTMAAEGRFARVRDFSIYRDGGGDTDLIIVRGKDERGADLVIARDYISHGLRERASELVDLDLGPRTEAAIEQRLRAEVEQERLTSIDRAMLREADSGVLVSSQGRGAFGQSIRMGRLRKLEGLGLATKVGAAHWRLAPGLAERRNHWEKTSHSLLVGAILHILYAEEDKTLARVATFLSDPQRPLVATLRRMMTTNHLGSADAPRVHPVVASAARELLNKSENERSGVLSTAMSFLGLYRDPTVAAVTSRCDWRIADLVEADHPVSLYLVIPPSDISRTKPLVRLILNQIGRRLTEKLDADGASGRRHQLLMMLDEFPALGRLDFFETSLAFMAGYGVRAFLIAQSLNQIEKAYGEHNAILDNCHVRIAFATNDERTARRISDALGVATEQRSMRNYAGHRLAPWLAHVMVSRQETARPLLTQGEVMQLPPANELVLVSGMAPIRARKLRYYEDRNFRGRVLPPPALGTGGYADRPAPRADDWSGLVREADDRLAADARTGADDDGGLEQQRHPAIEGPAPVSAPAQQLELPDLERDDPDAAADKRVMDRVRATIVRGQGRRSFDSARCRDRDRVRKRRNRPRACASRGGAAEYRSIALSSSPTCRGSTIAARCVTRGTSKAPRSTSA